jgi:hypothetical protein
MFERFIAEHSWLVFTLAAAAWLFRLWQLKLGRQYPTLVAFLLYLITDSVVSHLLTLSAFRYPGATWYRWFYFTTQPVFWLLSFLVVLEVYSRMLSGYRGFQRLGDLAKYAALGGVALVISMVILFDASDSGPSTLAVQVIMLQQRAVYVALTTLCLILASFAAVFHLSIPRNVQYTFAVFGLMFSGFAVLDTLGAHLGDEARIVQAIAVPVLYVGGLVAGACLFTAAGEQVAEQAHEFSPLSDESESMVLGRLEGFNQLLLKVLRS